MLTSCVLLVLANSLFFVPLLYPTKTPMPHPAQLIATQRALFSAGAPAAAAARQQLDTPGGQMRFAAVTSDRILRGQGGEPGAGDGGFFSPRIRSPSKGRRFTAAAETEEARQWARFHELATARKLFLASRGYETEGVFIEELFDEAKRAQVQAHPHKHPHTHSTTSHVKRVCVYGWPRSNAARMLLCACAPPACVVAGLWPDGYA